MQRTNVYIDAETYEKLIKYSEEVDRTKSWIIRKALNEFLDGKDGDE